MRPVRAKRDARQAAGLEPATAALFANEFGDSELGHIPKGWDIRGLDKIAHYLNGVALQKYPPGRRSRRVKSAPVQSHVARVPEVVLLLVDALPP